MLSSLLVAQALLNENTYDTEVTLTPHPTGSSHLTHHLLMSIFYCHGKGKEEDGLQGQQVSGKSYQSSAQGQEQVPTVAWPREGSTPQPGLPDES